MNEEEKNEPSWLWLCVAMPSWSDKPHRCLHPSSRMWTHEFHHPGVDKLYWRSNSCLDGCFGLHLYPSWLPFCPAGLGWRGRFKLGSSSSLCLAYMAFCSPNARSHALSTGNSTRSFGFIGAHLRMCAFLGWPDPWHLRCTLIILGWYFL